MANNWAIVIGINQYRFLQPLKYAKRDAEAMRDFLAHEAKFDRIFLFSDDSPEIGGKPTEPFRANLLRVLRQIFATPFMNDGDNFWFFFSGHGIRHNEQDYLMPLDGDPEDVEHTGIPTNLITRYLRSCGADNVVMILDACRSGGKKSGEGIGRQTEEEARQTGVISIFSCSPDQYSYEIEAIGQGAFTYSLLEGLSIRGRCATVERLNQYLQSQVPQLVQQYWGRARQIPYTIAEPITRSHLILMPQHASLADIATLKNDAYYAQIEENWDLAERLWIRVLVAASGQDTDAIKALQKIAIKRSAGTIPTQPKIASKFPESSKPVVNPAVAPESPKGNSPQFPPLVSPGAEMLLHNLPPPVPAPKSTPASSVQYPSYLKAIGVGVGVGLAILGIIFQFGGDSSPQDPALIDSSPQDPALISPESISSTPIPSGDSSPTPSPSITPSGDSSPTSSSSVVSVRGFPPGTSEDVIVRELGHPNQERTDGNARVVVYAIRDTVDLVYIYEPDGDRIQQTEALFDPYVDFNVMRTVLNGMLDYRSNETIEQGLRDVRDGRIPTFPIDNGRFQGAIERSGDRIHIWVR